MREYPEEVSKASSCSGKMERLILQIIEKERKRIKMMSSFKLEGGGLDPEEELAGIIPSVRKFF